MEEKSELTIKVDEKEEIEIFVSIIILGLCTALREGVLGIEDAEGYLYNPYSMERLKKLAVNQELIDIVHLGAELEDIKSLLPDELAASIEEIEQKTLQFIQAWANHLPNALPRKKWIRD